MSAGRRAFVDLVLSGLGAAVFAVVVAAAGIVAAGVLGVFLFGSGMAAAAFAAGFLVVLSRMLAILVAAARTAETARVLVLVRHNISCGCMWV
jgi:hypothetical protein